MSSKRRIQASRANGAKSKGPVTPEGKLKSSGNSVRHGILSTLIVLDDENQETFAELLANLIAEFNPQTEAQRILVDTMAAARWRLMRIWAIERETLQSEVEKHDVTLPAATCAARAFRDLANNSRTLDLLIRYESRFDRQFARSLNQFMKLAKPENPLTQTCQTNLIPEADTPSDSPSSAPAADSTSLPTADGIDPPDLQPARRPIAVPSSTREVPSQTESQELDIYFQTHITPIPRAG